MSVADSDHDRDRDSSWDLEVVGDNDVVSLAEHECESDGGLLVEVDRVTEGVSECECDEELCARSNDRGRVRTAGTGPSAAAAPTTAPPRHTEGAPKTPRAVHANIHSVSAAMQDMQHDNSRA